MNQGYVSDFPGIEKVDAVKTFAAPGYHEQRQKTPGNITAYFVLSLASFLLPPFTSVLAVVVLPLSLTAWKIRRRQVETQPGNGMLRAAIGLCAFSIGLGLEMLLFYLLLQYELSDLLF